MESVLTHRPNEWINFCHQKKWAYIKDKSISQCYHWGLHQSNGLYIIDITLDVIVKILSQKTEIFYVGCCFLLYPFLPPLSSLSLSLMSVCHGGRGKGQENMDSHYQSICVIYWVSDFWKADRLLYGMNKTHTVSCCLVYLWVVSTLIVELLNVPAKQNVHNVNPHLYFINSSPISEYFLQS